MKLEKKKQREKVLAKRNNLSDKDKIKKSAAIRKKLFSLPEFQSAKRIMFYAAFRNEVATEKMIKAALKQGKEAVLPSSDQQNKRLILSQIKNYDRELKEGAYGIKEPAEEYYRPVTADSLDLVIVPGVAFDSFGNRLGYGGGYYDSFLVEIPSIPRIALSFEVQIVGNIAVEPHDQPMNKIITESRVISIDKR